MIRGALCWVDTTVFEILYSGAGLHNLNLCLRDVYVGLNVPAETREIQEIIFFLNLKLM